MLRYRRGLSLIDVIVGVALMLTMFLALFSVLRASLMLSTLAKAKSAGIELASTQMEYLHGLSYDSVGTVGGIPAGLVPQLATSTVDGVVYTTRTYIEYKDDSADGLGASDTNGVTTDYKTAKVTVSYTIGGSVKSITLVSALVPAGIESTTGGGTLSLRVVNASGAGVSNASVQITNASTSPSVSLSTISDTSGYVIIGGAATSSQYQVAVTKAGYSSAQTYARTLLNVNPTPGYLTVAKDQTTSATFAIDLLANLVVSSFTNASTTSFSDLFANSSSLADQSNTQVAGGALVLSAGALAGIAHSTSITPSALTGWGILSANLSTPAGTTAVVRVNDAGGTPVPDTALAGNSAGFSTFPVSLTGLSTSTYPALVLEASLTSDATTTTPSILDWTLSYSLAPTPLPNFAFTLTGNKTIGTNGSGQSIYKTVVNDTTGATGTKTESLEWDAYKLSFSGSLLEACPSSPYPLAPAQASSTSLIVDTPTAVTLPIVVETATNAPIANAKVVLTKSGYAATGLTSACGLSYFGGLSAGSYTATVSSTGYTTKTVSGISVAGHTATTTITLP